MVTKTALKTKISGKVNGQIAELERQLAETEAEIESLGSDLGAAISQGQVPDELVEKLNRATARKPIIQDGLSALGVAIKEQDTSERAEALRKEATELAETISMNGIQMLQDARRMFDQGVATIRAANKLPPAGKVPGLKLPNDELNFVNFLIRNLDVVLSAVEMAYTFSPKNSLMEKAGLFQRNKSRPAPGKEERALFEAKMDQKRHEIALEKLKDIQKSQATRATQDLSYSIAEQESFIERARERVSVCEKAYRAAGG